MLNYVKPIFSIFCSWLKHGSSQFSLKTTVLRWNFHHGKPAGWRGVAAVSAGCLGGEAEESEAWRREDNHIYPLVN